MKRTRRILGIMLALTLATGQVVFAATSTAATASKIVTFLKPDVSVELNREMLEFKDANGKTVYPIIYNGSTYLPIRAISGLMGENIEWVNSAKTVYIGKTLSNPSKSILKKEESPYVKVVSQRATGEQSLVQVHVKKDILIMYDFEKQNFKDANGNQVYPIVYEGSTYLPIRAIAELMGEDIEWDSKTKTVYIGSLTPVENEEPEKVRKETDSLINLYDREAELYNDATLKIGNISKWTKDDSLMMAAAISTDYANAQRYTQEARDLAKTTTFTDKEKAAAKALMEFAEMNEYYILVMENIGYMAASNQDYSALAETFLNFALEANNKMDIAREAIQCL